MPSPVSTNNSATNNLLLPFAPPVLFWARPHRANRQTSVFAVCKSNKTWWTLVVCCARSHPISPDPLPAEREILGGGKINVESLILLEARPCAGESDAEIVAGAWDFERINRRYVRHLNILEERPGNAIGNVAAAKALLRWSATEREAWLDAVINDPLLPGRILPSDYLGQQAWRRRVEVLRDANRQLRTFKPE